MKIITPRIIVMALLISTSSLGAGTLYLKAGYAFQPFYNWAALKAAEVFQIGSHYLIRPTWEFQAEGLIFGVSTGIDLNCYKLFFPQISTNSSEIDTIWICSTLRVPVELTVAKGLDLSSEWELRFTGGLTVDTFLYTLTTANGETWGEQWVFQNPRALAHLRFGVVAKAGVIYKIDDHFRLSGELPIHVVVNPNNYNFIQFNIGIDIGIGYSF